MFKPIRAAGASAGVLLAVTALPAAAQAVPHSKASGLSHHRVCSEPSTGSAACDALVVTDSEGHAFNARPHATSSVAGYHPSDLQSAYKLPSSTAGSGQTVAIVDAYDDPRAATDVGTYRSQFGLTPLATCSVSSTHITSPGGPCFAKVGQSGSTTTLPRGNGGWAQEESLDVDMVSAICPNCNIVLVEASSASLANLGSAVNEAAKLNANVISNSYGGNESSSDTSYDSSYYQHPGIAVVASSGDSGYGSEYPATSQYVTAAGGTSLATSSTTRGWSETAWSSAGSGCSGYDPRPSWQSSVANITGACARRAEADVSAVADPNTGVSVYDSYSYQGASGWLVFGGTSVASPIIGSVYALAGNAASVLYGSYPYSHTSSLFDVTSGSNGSCGTTVCNATAGWDGPTGLGTPNGTGAF
jgi:subtilase family serine protease